VLSSLGAVSRTRPALSSERARCNPTMLTSGMFLRRPKNVPSVDEARSDAAALLKVPKGCVALTVVESHRVGFLSLGGEGSQFETRWAPPPTPPGIVAIRGTAASPVTSFGEQTARHFVQVALSCARGRDKCRDLFRRRTVGAFLRARARLALDLSSSSRTKCFPARAGETRWGDRRCGDGAVPSGACGRNSLTVTRPT
jgi:hypothetical protein